jgi:nucleoside-diphosphate-sugar epimerase
MVFASTCSNYGRMADPTVPITEEGELAPVSLYAEQKVGIEQALLGNDFGDLRPTCLRFATVYGVGPRMRFDLTVNEFTRDLWADRELEVFGEQFWRPYIHVRDAARAIGTALEADVEIVGGQVFNAGRSGENYRKLDIVEVIGKVIPGKGTVTYVKRDEDPRDYKVSFDKIRETLGFETTMTVPDGIAELAEALGAGRFEDPWAPRYRNIP